MIKLDQIRYVYDTQQMAFNLAVSAGQIVTILGPSGAGKSTLLNLIAGFIEPNSGQIWLNGHDATHASPARRPVSMLFQDNNLFTHLSVKDNLALGLSPSLKLTQAQQQQLYQIANSIGLERYLNSYPTQLSGGQKQRVAIGRCLLQHRPILLLDEPFSSLDPKLKKEMFELLYAIKQQYQLTILMVTHQLEDIPLENNRCLMVVDGKIIFDGSYQQLMAQKKVSTFLGIE